jgi:hypothetical protein
MLYHCRLLWLVKMNALNVFCTHFLLYCLNVPNTPYCTPMGCSICCVFFGQGCLWLIWECGFLNLTAHRNSLVTRGKPRNTSLSGTAAFNTQEMVMREGSVQPWQHQRFSIYRRSNINHEGRTYQLWLDCYGLKNRIWTVFMFPRIQYKVTTNLQEYGPSVHITYKHNNKNIIHMHISVL